MSTVARFSFDQYELMIEAGAFAGKHRQRVELIRGEIRQMSPIGAPHARFVDLLTRLSIELLPESRAWVRIQSTLAIPALDSAPEPDVLWLAPRDYSERHPEPQDALLVIEVADTTLALDLGEKALLYAEAGIVEYWVVNLIDRCVEVFREPSASGYSSHTTLRGNDEVRPVAFSDLALRPAALVKP